MDEIIIFLPKMPKWKNFESSNEKIKLFKKILNKKSKKNSIKDLPEDDFKSKNYYF